MTQFTSAADVPDIETLIREALSLKQNPLKYNDLGKNKTLGLIFMNPSLRTRLSTQIAAQNLGMHVLTVNAGKDSWALEFRDRAVMDGDTVEHIRDAAPVLGSYCDIIGVRCFPGLKSKEEDYGEHIMRQFIQHTKKPYLSLESATLHPLQSLADVMTISEHRPAHRPKVVLSWAPHIKPLPHAVANSFAEWLNRLDDVDFVIAHPEGYELDPRFTGKAAIAHNQQKALEGADFVYVKNWSSYRDYGEMPYSNAFRMLDGHFLETNPQTKIMHCLPVRRNVELSDAVLDSPQSLVQAQAENRIYAAQAVLKRMLHG